MMCATLKYFGRNLATSSDQLQVTWWTRLAAHRHPAAARQSSVARETALDEQESKSPSYRHPDLFNEPLPVREYRDAKKAQKTQARRLTHPFGLAFCKRIALKRLPAWRCESVARPPPFKGITPMDMRIIAIIAHVDHGKTTLVDEPFLNNLAPIRKTRPRPRRAMGQQTIWRRARITIFAKPTSGCLEQHRNHIVDNNPVTPTLWRVGTHLRGRGVVCSSMPRRPMPKTKFCDLQGAETACGLSLLAEQVERQTPAWTARWTIALSVRPAF